MSAWCAAARDYSPETFVGSMGVNLGVHIVCELVLGYFFNGFYWWSLVGCILDWFCLVFGWGSYFFSWRLGGP